MVKFDMLRNYVVFDVDASTPVLVTIPEIKHWAVESHSLGGAMPANFAYKKPLR